MGMLESVLESGKFGITVEMAPPKGYDFSEQMEAAELLKKMMRPGDTVLFENDLPDNYTER